MLPTSSYRAFALLSTASVVIWWHAISATIALALRRDAYTHILLILPVSITLILIERRRNGWQSTPDIRVGCWLLGLPVLVSLAGMGWDKVVIPGNDTQLAIEVLAAILSWIGSFVACFGRRIARRCIFPLLFLLWLVPLPESMLNHIIGFLQQSTAVVARLMLTSVGTPVAQDGIILTLPGISLEIAQECSSIRSTTMLVVTSMVVSHACLASFWGRTIVTLMAVPLSIVRNALRVFTLGMFAIHHDVGVLDSPLHRQGGVMFFSVSLAVLLLFAKLVAMLEERSYERLNTTSDPGRRPQVASPG